MKYRRVDLKYRESSSMEQNLFIKVLENIEKFPFHGSLLRLHNKARVRILKPLQNLWCGDFKLSNLISVIDECTKSTLSRSQEGEMRFCPRFLSMNLFFFKFLSRTWFYFKLILVSQNICGDETIYHDRRYTTNILNGMSVHNHANTINP